jgi:hypothetical protein
MVDGGHAEVVLAAHSHGVLVDDGWNRHGFGQWWSCWCRRGAQSRRGRGAGEASGALGASAVRAPEVGEDWMPGASWVEVVPAGAAARRE